MSLSVKEAINKAFEYAKEFYDAKGTPNLKLEGVETLEEKDKEHWLITLGYDTSEFIYRESGYSLFPNVEKEKKREYKNFLINKENGELIWMKRG